jgi:gamma-glutamyltranspeptidase/glutathione hydrolase
MYLDASGRVTPNKSTDGPLAAAIPGTPAALEHLANNYGRLPLAVSLAPAIELARDGFEVSKSYYEAAKLRAGALLLSTEAAKTFLRNGQVPAPGSIIHQPQLADTLALIAREGAKAFYTGHLARRLVDGVRANGGIWTEEDLSRYEVIERAPLIGQYHDMRVVSVPPPSSGGTVLIETLNILEGYGVAKMNAARPQAHHRRGDAARVQRSRGISRRSRIR